MKIVYAGFSCEANEDWKSLIPEFDPPSNYVNDDAKERYVQRQVLAVAELAPYRPLLGRVTKVALHEEGGVTWTGNAVELQEKLAELRACGEKVVIFGAELKERFHLAALSALQAGCDVDRASLLGTEFQSLNEWVSLQFVNPVSMVIRGTEHHDGSPSKRDLDTMIMYMAKRDQLFASLHTAVIAADFMRAVVHEFKLHEFLDDSDNTEPSRPTECT